MKILLTNDDGIAAPGIVALHHAMDGLGDITVVAPKTVQSATSHGITYSSPLMVTDVRVTPTMGGQAVDGRPADCVKLALTSLWPDKHGSGSRPDLVVSGMNAGANCGINVLYSGTVAAAIEAAFLGVPAIAVSLHLDNELMLDRPTADFPLAARVARRVIDDILSSGPPDPHQVLSINIPATPYLKEDAETVVCPMNTHALVDRYEKRAAPNGDVYYWPAGSGLDFRGADAGTDVPELLDRKVTITPLSFDLTDHAALAGWRKRLRLGV